MVGAKPARIDSRQDIQDRLLPDQRSPSSAAKDKQLVPPAILSRTQDEDVPNLKQDGHVEIKSGSLSSSGK